MKKAMVAGHICLDITPAFPDDTYHVKDPVELLKRGGLLQVGSPDIHTGGAVANTGLAMKKLGCDVKLVGKVGADPFGVLVKNILNEYDAGADLITDETCSTSYSVVLAIPGTDRVFLHDPGANAAFDGSEISEEALAGTDLFHFGYPTLMKLLYENDGVRLKELFVRVKEKGIVTSLDMAAIDPSSEAGSVDWTAVLANVLPYTDIFAPSFEELCFMLDRPRLEGLYDRSGGRDITEIIETDTDIIPLSRMCHKMGAKIVLIKCGAPGMFLSVSDDFSGFGRLGLDEKKWKGYRAFQKSFRIPHVVSATGAGDVSIAGFLTSLLLGADPEIALQNAAACGALCCMTYDAISNLVPLGELKGFISSHRSS